MYLVLKLFNKMNKFIYVLIYLSYISDTDFIINEVDWF